MERDIKKTNILKMEGIKATEINAIPKNIMPKYHPHIFFRKRLSEITTKNIPDTTTTDVITT